MNQNDNTSFSSMPPTKKAKLNNSSTHDNTFNLITSHLGSDFDSFGSMIGASKLYPNSYILWPGSTSPQLENIVRSQTTNPLFHKFIFTLDNLNELVGHDYIEYFKLLIVVDTNKISRLKHISPLIEHIKSGKIDLIVFDHHPLSNDDISSLKPTANHTLQMCGAATSLLVREISKKDKSDEPIYLDITEATWMGVAIYEDTGHLMYPSVDFIDFDALSFLKKNGMDLHLISDYLHGSSNVPNTRTLDENEHQVFSEICNNLREYNIAEKIIHVSVIKSSEEIKNFSPLVQKVLEEKNLKALFTIGSFDKCSVLVARSESKEYLDVSEVCRHFGGGGHHCAASARCKDYTSIELQERLIEFLISNLDTQLLTLESLMTKPVLYLQDTDNIDHAHKLFLRLNLKRVPVVNNNNSIIGILDRIATEKALGHGFSDTSITEFMETNFQVLSFDSESSKAVDLLLNTPQRLLPIVDDNKNMIAVVSRSDVISAVMKNPARFPQYMNPKPTHNLSSSMPSKIPVNIYHFLKDAGKLGDEMGFKVYIAGGFVRDFLLKRTSDDIDLVIDGNGLEYAEKLASKIGAKKLEKHEAFLTAVMTLPSGLKIDVATARLEYYPSPVALPVVELSSLKMDLYRRDFSINAMAIQLNDLHFGSLQDFFSGYDDLNKKKINVLHSLSFVEDPTRIFRAIRFEQRFGFNIGGHTENLLRSALRLKILEKLTGARLLNEIKKIIKDENPVACFDRLHKLKILESIHSSLKKYKHERIEKSFELIKHVQYLNLQSVKIVSWKFILIAISMNMSDKEYESLLDRLLAPTKELVSLLSKSKQANVKLKAIYKTKRNPDPSEVYFILKDMPIEGILWLMLEYPEDRQRFISYLTVWKDVKLDINGGDLKDLEVPTGPLFKLILDAVMKAKLDGEVTGKESQLEYAKKTWKENE